MENEYNKNFTNINSFFNIFDKYIRDINNIDSNKIDYIKYATVIKYHEYYNLLHFDSKPLDTNQITLLIPSIFNSPAILFHDDAKLMSIINQSSSCYMIDWQQITKPHFCLDDYIFIIIFIIDKLYYKYKKPINIIGHCISGTLTLGAAFIKQKYINKILLLTTPWDFSNFLPSVLWAKQYGIIEYMQKFEYIPHNLVKIFFFFLSKQSFHEKLSIYHNIHDINQKLFFLSIESWQTSGLNMPIGVFNQLINDFILKNNPVHNKWLIKNHTIDLRLLNNPVTMIFGSNDNIVPANLIYKIENSLPNMRVKIFDCGHLGFLIGKAKIEFFKILQNWLDE